MLLMHVFSLVLPTMLAVDPYCTYEQRMDVVPTYYVYNKEYPGSYGRNQDCLWKAVAPEGYLVEATCSFELPNSFGCTDDRVSISGKGLPTPENEEVFCGSGNKMLTTEENTITIRLQSSSISQGGRFLCTLQAKQSNKPSCNCGWKNTRRIVGGTETKINEYPMMAGLVDFNLRDIFCGASIIAKRYVLTAAHCLETRGTKSVGVLVGDHNVTSGTETGKSSLLRSKKFVLHHKYNKKTAKNDIAIIQTERAIAFNWAVGPVCLPFAYSQDSFEGQTVEALGWGTTEFTGPASEVLLKTDLDVLDYRKCYNDVNGTVDQLCTYRKGHDSCQKDSGGPVLWTDFSSRLYLVGVISNGFGCATEKPGVNTRVTSYLTWILSNIPNTQICVQGP